MSNPVIRTTYFNGETWIEKGQWRDQHFYRNDQYGKTNITHSALKSGTAQGCQGI